MGTKTPQQILERAQQQKEKAEAQIKQATKLLRDRERKAATRQKVILGASLMAKAENDKYARRALLDIFKGMSERDAALFEGWPLQKEARGDASPVISLD